MNKLVIKYSLIISLTLLSLSSLLSASKTYETQIQFDSEQGVGSQSRKLLNQATKLILERKYNEANALLDQAILRFQKITPKGNKSAVYLCFQSKEELAAYRKLHPIPNIVWLDSSYGHAYHLKGFICVNQNNIKKAKEFLMIEKALSPMDAGVRTELGFIAHREKKYDAALNYYSEALELAHKFKSQQQWEAPALRGLGSTLIDLDKLSKAEECFNQSLKIDPNNKIAISELTYIKGLKNRKVIQHQQ